MAILVLSRLVPPSVVAASHRPLQALLTWLYAAMTSYARRYCDIIRKPIREDSFYVQPACKTLHHEDMTLPTHSASFGQCSHRGLRHGVLAPSN